MPAAACKASENEQQRAKGLPVESSTGALSTERHKQLKDITPSWRLGKGVGTCRCDSMYWAAAT
ncbi:hypothetical protein [Streptomyces sp. NPDC088757]|uniref:hypothetical protein n=1 Tax=Streptomyces sp. NPDC088757 TaxID=3365889 RepID=UPI0037F79CE4